MQLSNDDHHLPEAIHPRHDLSGMVHNSNMLKPTLIRRMPSDLDDSVHITLSRCLKKSPSRRGGRRKDVLGKGAADGSKQLDTSCSTMSTTSDDQTPGVVPFLDDSDSSFKEWAKERQGL